MRIIQDGALFFDEDTGEELFASEIIVSDADVLAACAARLHFELWAIKQGLIVEFEGP